ncbi:MAG TPA: ComEC/Rec2 family competence protein, partial [Methylomirabilota bacterium]|nr:ComEC/Rec2 family competence protein [Methylomirabilota bacterium]
GLIWFGATIARRLARWPAWIREPVALTLAAQLTTLPVILVNFERLSLVAPVANVMVVPLVPLVMLCSAVAALAGLLDALVHLPAAGDALTWFAGGTAWLLLRLMIMAGEAAASVPHAAVEVSVPPALAVAWLPIVGLASWALRDPASKDQERGDEAEAGAALAMARRVFRPLPALGVLLAILLTVTFVSRPDGQLHVTVLDVGQGDAILVEAPDGSAMLVDGGPDPELTLRRLGANLPWFARRIEVMVLTHPHQDHVAGLVEVLGRFRVELLLHAGIGFENSAYDRLLADAATSPTVVVHARAGQSITLDPSTTVEVLYPAAADAAGPLPDGDINNGSVVLRVRHAGFTALLTGDAEAPVESALVARGLLGPVDLLKVGHHGSHSSTTPGFLSATRPSVAVISSGAGNEYGHPAPETLSALAGIAVLRTDLHGDVEIASDGASCRIRTNAGWSAPRPVHAAGGTGRIGAWPFPTDPPPDACWPRPSCPMASSFTPPAGRASPSRPRGWWPGRRFPSTTRWSRPLHCCTTSTRSRSGAAAASTASSARGGSRRRATPSSPCRSPPTRSTACSTTIAFPSAGRRSWSPWPTGTWRRCS